MSLTESKFLPSLMTSQLMMAWAMARSAGWAMGAAWSSPHLPSSFCSALKNQDEWKLILEAEGSCCPAQWVLWSSLLLSHKGLNRHETGPRVGQDWVLGRRWIIPPGTALVWVNTALLPPLLCSVLWAFLLWSCLYHVENGLLIEKLLFPYSHRKVKQNYLNKFRSTMGRKSLCNLHHLGNLSIFAVLSHQPNQYRSKTAVWWCYSCYCIGIFHCSIDRDILHTNITVAILVLYVYTYHDK